RGPACRRGGRREGHLERLEEDGLRGGGGEPRIEVRQGRPARRRDRRREGIPEAAPSVSMQPPPPPPPPPPGDDGGFTAPPLWLRGQPVEIRDPTLTNVYDAAYNFYRLHWRALIAVVAFLIVPLQFASEFLTRNYPLTRILGAVVADRSQSGRVAVIGGVISLIHLLVVNPLLTGAVARSAAGFYLGEDPSAGNVLEFGLSKLAPIALVVVLSLLAVAGGLLLLIIPGLVFLVRFAFAPSVVMIEDIRGTEAMRRSWRLAKGSS